MNASNRPSLSRRFEVAAMVMLCLLAWTALGGCNRGGGAGAGSDADHVIRVTRNVGGREGFRRHWDAWAAAFAKANPGWKMELIDLGNADGAEYYKSRIATDDLPEVVMTWSYTKFLVDSGHGVPLDDAFYSKFGLSLPPPYHGKRYTCQGGDQIMGIAVNRKMWADVGIAQPPATWDAFVAGLRKIKAAGHQPLAFGGREWSAGYPLLLALATDLYEHEPIAGKPSWNVLRDQGKVHFATDPTALAVIGRMIQFADEFAEKGSLSSGYNEEQRDFYSGRAATWMMGCWMAGDVESRKCDFEIDYWPVPSMTGKKPVFILTSRRIQSGWMITTSATGEKLAKARRVLEAFNDPQVYQLFLNGECQFGTSDRLPKNPKSSWPPAQKLFDNMAARRAQYGDAAGTLLALDDQPPASFQSSLTTVMQEILSGRKDIDRLLKILDEDWDSARKGQ